MPIDPASHPANQGLRRYREPRVRAGFPPVARPGEVDVDAYYGLGTHPDLVAHLWDVLGAVLPEDCRFVFFGGPALLRPDSGIVFGFAGGTHAYALRLPEPVRAAALADGAERVHTYSIGGSFDLDEIGPEWVFCRWNKAEKEWCRAAYEFAAPDPLP